MLNGLLEAVASGLKRGGKMRREGKNGSKTMWKAYQSWLRIDCFPPGCSTSRPAVGLDI